MNARTLAGQALLYAAFAAVIGLFSRWPTYSPLGPGQALVRLSIVHAGQLVSPCHRLTDAELAKLPPNMRAPEQCPRERAPVAVQVDIDGQTLVDAVAPPSGIARDGRSALYRRLPVAAGTHRIAVRLKDSAGPGGFDHARTATVTLVPGQVLVIDYLPEQGGITLP